MALSRLGVAKIIIFDNDTVDITNLNRQLLFEKKDVGSRKVDAAESGINRHSPGTTVVEKHHVDALAEWHLVVQKAREAQVVFNCIDVGKYFDFSVLTLCKVLMLPYVSGSSYSNTLIVEFFPGLRDFSSFGLDVSNLDSALVARLSETSITQLQNISFVPPDPKPNTRDIGSSVLVAGTCGLFVVNAWVQAINGRQTSTSSVVDCTETRATSETDTKNAGRGATPTIFANENAECALPPVPNFLKMEMHSFWDGASGDLLVCPQQRITEKGAAAAIDDLDN
jgi:molybdopterin/thiamine biosynthesis adenylyltransferase